MKLINFAAIRGSNCYISFIKLDVNIQMTANWQLLHLILLMLFEVVLTQKLLSPEGGIVVSQ